MRSSEIHILLGYEVDFLPNRISDDVMNTKVDYFIGSVHFIDEWGFDNPEFIGKYKHKDRVMRTAKSTSVPFLWRDAAKTDQLSPIEKQIFNEAADFGMSEGLTVPIHAPACLFPQSQ